MAGNSTMADKPFKDGNPEKGWGQILPLYFTKNVIIENHAKNGRSTKSFIDEGRWDSLLNRVKPGNYVIIEFGHNDAKQDDPKRFADARTTYRENLMRFIHDARNRQGIPVLATPIVRRRFTREGEFYDVHGEYPVVVREIAAELQVLLIDLHASSEALLKQYGAERSKMLFLHIEPGEYPSLPEGKKDDTHFSPYGAFRICDLALREIKEKIPALLPYIKE
ncbi:MAG: rhamnogalacturonan acetylesterase [Ignavibacteriales bacterium]|nr:MAG: rhamnogalacturonan acetylesterase [Ignavibacteriales bacterium]